MGKTIFVEVVGNASQFKKELTSAVASTEKANSSFRRIGKAAGIAGLAIAGGLAVGIDKSVKAALEGQAATAKLDQAFTNAHLSADKYKGTIDNVEASSRKLGFTNEDTRNSMARILTATGNVRDAMRDLTLAEDVSRLKGVDLSTATQMVTSTLSGNVRAAKALGIVLLPVTSHVDALKEKYKQLHQEVPKSELDAAKLADKQATAAEALQKVTDKVHGQADAFAQTAAGKLQAYNAEMQNLKEKLGDALLPAVNKIVDGLTRFADFLAQHKTTVEVFAIALAGLAAAFIALSVGITIAELAMSPLLVPVLAVIAALAILGTAVYLLVTDFKKWWPLLLPIVLGPLGAIIAAVIHWHGAIVGAFEAAWNAVKGATIAAWNAIKSAVTSAVHAVVSAIEGAVGAAVGAAQRLASGVLNAIRSAMSRVGQAVVNAMTALKNAIISAAGDAFRLAVNVGRAIVDGVVSGLAGLPGRVAGAVKDALSAGIHAGAHLAGKILHGSGEFMFTKQAIGEPMVDGIIEGIRGREPQLEKALMAAILTATAHTRKALGPSGPVKDAIGAALGLSDSSGDNAWSPPVADPSRADASGSGWFDISGNFHTGTPPSGDPSGFFGISGNNFPIYGMPDMSAFPAGTATFGAPNPAAGGDINITFPNYLGNKQDVTDTIRSELLRIKSRNGTLGLG